MCMAMFGTRRMEWYAMLCDMLSRRAKRVVGYCNLIDCGGSVLLRNRKVGEFAKLTLRPGVRVNSMFLQIRQIC